MRLYNLNIPTAAICVLPVDKKPLYIFQLKEEQLIIQNLMGNPHNSVHSKWMILIFKN
ncbi:hypothetical protein [Christiangramia sp.]|uniref:hypothetical protein n=1 Tax=Christiangramia sp. TaxID=1931228 RepID=UPI003242B434